jgi:hypothetical protein
MNYQIFYDKLTKEVGKPHNKPVSQVASAYADAYDLACKGSCKTMFGAVLMTGNKNILKKKIEESLKTQSYVKDSSSPGTLRFDSAYKTMAEGFNKYWVDSKFTPMPPSPPCISFDPQSQNPGVKVSPNPPPQPTFVGVEYYAVAFGNYDFAGNLKSVWQIKDWKKFVDSFYDTLLEFHLTLNGTYNGRAVLVPAPSPVPLSVKWYGIVGGTRRKSLSNYDIALSNPVPHGRGTDIPLMRDWEATFRVADISSNREYMIAIDPRLPDELLFLQGGFAASAAPLNPFNWDKMKRGQNVIVSHVHPWDEGNGVINKSGFSPQDIWFAIHNNLSEMRVSNKFYTYVLQRPAGGWSTYRVGKAGKRKADGTFNKEDTGINPAIRIAIELEFDQIQDLKRMQLDAIYSDSIKYDNWGESIHYANRVLSKKYGYKYERVPVEELRLRGKYKKEYDVAMQVEFTNKIPADFDVRPIRAWLNKLLNKNF